MRSVLGFETQFCQPAREMPLLSYRKKTTDVPCCPSWLMQSPRQMKSITT
jgi:hypothetical protein